MISTAVFLQLNASSFLNIPVGLLRSLRSTTRICKLFLVTSSSTGCRPRALTKNKVFFSALFFLRVESSLVLSRRSTREKVQGGKRRRRDYCRQEQWRGARIRRRRSLCLPFETSCFLFSCCSYSCCQSRLQVCRSSHRRLARSSRRSDSRSSRRSSRCPSRRAARSSRRSSRAQAAARQAASQATAQAATQDRSQVAVQVSRAACEPAAHAAAQSGPIRHLGRASRLQGCRPGRRQSHPSRRPSSLQGRRPGRAAARGRRTLTGRFCRRRSRRRRRLCRSRRRGRSCKASLPRCPTCPTTTPATGPLTDLRRHARREGRGAAREERGPRRQGRHIAAKDEPLRAKEETIAAMRVRLCVFSRLLLAALRRVRARFAGSRSQAV